MANDELQNYYWGDNNLITIVEDGVERPFGEGENIRGLKISINGNNNRLRIEMPQKFADCTLAVVGDNNSFALFKARTKLEKIFFFVGDGCNLKIGRNCLLSSNISFLAKEKKGTRIIIGNNCAIAGDCIFRCGDGHTIIDIDSGEPLNEPDDIIVENHVWIGYRCIFLKGAYVAKNSVVGAMSLLNTSFEESNVVIAGTPARIVKHDVGWDMASWNEYTQKNMREEDEFLD